nr:alanine/glycine:cation symporter family protein [Kineosphaera limosa]
MLAIVGILFTIRMKGMQFRTMGTMLKVILKSRTGSEGGISSFQAFTISLASRVGTGNIAGVAIALAVGGPGAIFWMWVMALIGMATAFVEATLAQLYKQPHHDGTFRGGPAYYIQRGLGNRAFGVLFACLLIFTFGLAFNMVQANTIASVLESGHGVSPVVTAVVLAALTGVIIFGGLRSIARVTEIMAPLMALIYFLLAVVVVLTSLPAVPGVIADIFKGAFGLEQALAGTGGGMLAALMNGVQRGMFSNEAGMGSAPNAAATATVRHPVQQGLIQSAGVFVDTIIVCTATATMILLAGPAVYTPGVTTRAEAGAALTQNAIAAELGGWTIPLMTFLVFVFAFSSVLGNTSYAEINVDFLRGGRVGDITMRCVVVVAVITGALVSLTIVWTVADIAMTAMAVTNLVALLLLGKYVVALLANFEQQPSAVDATFDVDDLTERPPGVLEEVWGDKRANPVARD